MDTPEDKARLALAEERDRAVEAYTMQAAELRDVRRELETLKIAYRRLQQESKQFIMAFMLVTNQHKVEFGTAELRKAEGYVLQRMTTPDESHVTWELLSPQEAEQRKREFEEFRAQQSLLVQNQERIQRIIDAIPSKNPHMSPEEAQAAGEELRGLFEAAGSQEEIDAFLDELDPLMDLDDEGEDV